MNSNRYRLVFNADRGMYVPVQEGVAARGKRSTRVLSVLAASMLVGDLALAAPQVRAPLPAGTLPVPHAGKPFATAGAATHTRSGNTLTVNQSTQRAVLNWQSFNISRDSRVEFKQPGAQSAAMNLIWGADPSVIEGQLTANGQVYLYNRNGIVFGEGAQVDVAGLTASALRVSDNVFMSGVLAQRQKTLPVFVWDGSYDEFLTAKVTVEPGALIRVRKDGMAMLIAPHVQNHGQIETIDGQAILAAGAKVYLDPNAGSDGTFLARGVLVEVDPLVLSNQTATGSVTNGATGSISAVHGKINLVGYAVNQEGRLSATTGVVRNGAVFLTARHLADTTGSSAIATRGGELMVGSSSRISVMPDGAEKTIDQKLERGSTVEMIGKTVHLKGGSEVLAPGASVTLKGQGEFPNSRTTEGVRVLVDKGASIDVSGSEVDVDGKRNFVTADLFGNELKDVPLQREGVLYRKKVTYDLRKGIKVANTSGYEALIERSAAELTANGGRIVVTSTGDVVVRDGARFDVSGGQVRYSAVTDQQTTVLRQGSREVDIHAASPDLIYSGLSLGPKRDYQAYSEGRDAGTLDISAQGLFFGAKVDATRHVGIMQRAAPPQLGTVSFTVLRPSLTGTVAGPDAVIAAERRGELSPLFDDPDRAISAPLRYTSGAGELVDMESAFSLSPDLLAGGVGHLGVTVSGSIRVEDSLSLPTGGSLTLAAGDSVAINRSILAPSGRVRVTAGSATEALTPGITVADGVGIDVAGRWINDRVGELSSTSLTRGGSIEIDVLGSVAAAEPRGSLVFGQDTHLDVSGGAYLSAVGKPSFADGGAIRLAGGAMDIDSLQMSGFSGAQGGQLAVKSSRVRVGGEGSPGDQVLATTFFEQGGFSRYAISAVDSLTVSEGAVVRPAPLSFEMARGFETRAGGDLLGSVALLNQKASAYALPNSVSFSTDLGDLRFERGSLVDAGARGTIDMGAGRGMHVGGTMVAHGGKVALGLASKPFQGALPTDTSERVLHLTSDARVDVSGQSLVTVEREGRREGVVLPGGDASLTTKWGYIVADTGAVIDVRGAADRFTAAVASSNGGERLLDRDFASSGGSVRIDAVDGFWMDATLRAEGGTGASGGRLLARVDAVRPDLEPVSAEIRVELPNGRRTVTVGARDGLGVIGPLPEHGVTADEFHGRGEIGAERINAGRFADVTLSAQDAVAFAGDSRIVASRSVTIESPVLEAQGQAQLAVEAPFLRLSNADSAHTNDGFFQIPQQSKALGQAPTSGEGGLTLRAGQLIDLHGNVRLDGMRSVSLHAAHDIRGSGARTGPYDAERSGSLRVAGDLSLVAGQVYPTTGSSFRLEATGADSVLSIEPSGIQTSTPWSAGGKLSFKAPDIKQAGTVRAPFGEIAFDAGRTVELAPGSLTSVSGAGVLVPYGQTVNGGDWALVGRQDESVGDAFARSAVGAPPERSVTLRGAAVAVQSGAVVDASGGGALFAWEFVPGLTGSVDVVSSTSLFAVLPTYDAGFAPYDPAFVSGSQINSALSHGKALSVGQRITVAGQGELPDGVYTLLPAQYALLPGAFAVTVRADRADFTAADSLVLPNGAALMSGAVHTSDADASMARPVAVLVEPQRILKKRAEYRLTDADAYFGGAAVRDDAPVPQLSSDGGRVSVAGNSVGLEGALRLGQSTPGARGGRIELAAPKIALTRGSGPEGYLKVDPDDVLNSGAASLVLGGVSTKVDGASTLDVLADDVRIVDGASSGALAEFVAAARSSVTVDDGATIRVSGDGVFRDQQVLGDGALLRVASESTARTTRAGVKRETGSIQIAAGASMVGGVVELDSTWQTRFAPQVSLQARTLAVSASRVTFGLDVLEGIVFNPDLAQQFATAEAVSLRSYSSIDFFGAQSVGGVKSLTLDAAALRGFGAAGEGVNISATNLALKNTTGQVASESASGLGVLTLSGADRLTLGVGAKQVSGFAHTHLRAGSEIVLRVSNGDVADQLRVDADLSLTAQRVAGETGAQHLLGAGGDVTLSRSDSSTPLTAVSSLGASLTVRGASVTQGGVIDLPSGTIALEATGAGGDVRFLDGSMTAARGTKVRFDEVTKYSHGGSVTARSGQADVRVEAGATVDVSAVAEGGSAGGIGLEAGKGSVMIDGALAGKAGAGGRAGSLDIDAGLVSLEGVADALKGTGITRHVGVRGRTLGLRLGDDQVIAAESIVIASDGGWVDIRGRLDASGEHGGRIEVWAKDDIRLRGETGAALVATGASGTGGDVVLSSERGRLSLESGASVDLGGQRGAGSLTLRATVTDAADGGLDLAIDKIGADLDRVGGVIVEGVRAYEGVNLISNDERQAGKAGVLAVLGPDKIAGAVAAKISDATLKGVVTDVLEQSYLVLTAPSQSKLGDATLAGGSVLVADRVKSAVDKHASSAGLAAVMADEAVAGLTGTGTAFSSAGDMVGSLLGGIGVSSDLRATVAERIDADLADRYGSGARAVSRAADAAVALGVSPDSAMVKWLRTMGDVVDAARYALGAPVALRGERGDPESAIGRIVQGLERAAPVTLGAAQTLAPATALTLAKTEASTPGSLLMAILTQYGVDGNTATAYQQALDSAQAAGLTLADVQKAGRDALALRGVGASSALYKVAGEAASIMLAARASQVASSKAALAQTPTGALSASIGVWTEALGATAAASGVAAKVTAAMCRAPCNLTNARAIVQGAVESAMVSGLGEVELVAQLTGAMSRAKLTNASAVVTEAKTRLTNALKADDAAVALLPAEVAKTSVVSAVGKFAFGADALIDGLGLAQSVRDRTTARTGIEVRGDGDITLRMPPPAGSKDALDAWDLAQSMSLGQNGSVSIWKPTGLAGQLTIRAGGSLVLESGISDGFVDTNPNPALRSEKLGEANAYGIRLVAGADLRGAAPTARRSLDELDAVGAGDLLIGKFAPQTGAAQSAVSVRTGAADIELAAGRDLKMGQKSSTEFSTVFTAGRAGPTETRVLPGESINLDPAPQLVTPDGFLLISGRGHVFQVEGGDLKVSAQRDVVGNVAPSVHNSWLWRQGGTSPSRNVELAWWVRPDLFRQNFGALGGGNVDIRAGRDALNASAATPTHGYVANGELHVGGGGSVVVHAVRDIAGGQFLAMDGAGELSAGRDITFGRSKAATGAWAPVLSGSNVRWDVEAGRNAVVEGWLDPMIVPQTSKNLAEGTGGQSGNVFVSLSATDALSMTALTGNAALNGWVDRTSSSQIDKQSTALGLSVGTQNRITDLYRSVLPPSLDVSSFAADVSIRSSSDLGFVVLPDQRGNVNLLAANNVLLTDGWISMPDVAPTSLPSFSNYLQLASVQSGQGDLGFLGELNPIPKYRRFGPVPLHTDDDTRVRVVARSGDVVGGAKTTLVLNKAARIVAGRDIVSLGLSGQNNNSNDHTEVIAGRDIRYAVPVDTRGNLTISPVGIEVGGPGRLSVTAGRDIALGSGAGISTVGNLINPGLDEVGASLSVLAGSSVAFDAKRFSDLYLDAQTREAALLDLARALVPLVGPDADKLPDDALQVVKSPWRTTLLADLEAWINAKGSGVGAAQDVALPTSAAEPRLTRQQALQLFVETSSPEQAAERRRFVASRMPSEGLLADSLVAATNSASAAEGRDAVRNAFWSLADAERLAFASEVSRRRFADMYLGQTASGSGAPYSAAWQAFALSNGYDPDQMPNHESLMRFGQHVAMAEFERIGLRNAADANATLLDWGAAYSAVEWSMNSGVFQHDGNIDLSLSRIATRDGGDLSVSVPGGGVNVGFTTEPPGFKSGSGKPFKSAENLGLITFAGGRLDVLAQGEVAVNSSRVFTLGGGDLRLVSLHEGIDAGKGAKTTVVVPPPLVSLDANGNILVTLSGAATGSGIATLKSDPLAPAAAVGLYAPLGIINAGDAGIRSSGELVIGGNRVVGTDNIQAAGAILGAPPPPPPAPAPIAAPPSADAGRAAESALASAPTSSGAEPGSILTVEVLGFGDSDGLSVEAQADDEEEEDKRRRRGVRKSASGA